jgi:uncharacterized protein YjdB
MTQRLSRCPWHRPLRVASLFFSALVLVACAGGESGDGGETGPQPQAASLSRIEVAPDSAVIARGQSQTFTATAVYSDAARKPLSSDVQWSSSQTSVATIDGDGVATAVATGNTEIRARHQGFVGVAFLEVQPPALSSIEVAPSSASVPDGLTRQFSVIARYADGSTQVVQRSVIWSSSDADVATIDDAGLATGQSPGSVTIRARYQGKESSAQLLVGDAVVTDVVVTPTPLTLAVGATQQLSAAALFSNGSRVDNPSGVVWSSDASAIATVSGSGLVQAAAPGSTAIVATLGAKSGRAQVLVTALPPLPFQAGAAEVPAAFLPIPGSVCLGGYDLFCERNAFAEYGTKAMRPDPDALVAGAVAISGRGSQSFLLVKTTNVGYFAAYKLGNGPNGLYDIRQRIARRLDQLYPRINGRPVVSADQIVVTSDHSHHGPDTIGIWGGVSPTYMAILAQAAVDAGVQAFQARQPARLYTASVQGPQTAGSYSGPPTDDPDREFRVLYAENAQGARIATLMNYAPHATVLSSDNEEATGDWTTWAAQTANRQSGGIGLGLVGALGAMDWNKSGNNQQREDEARGRLTSMLNAAFAARSEVQGDTVAVKTVFIREPLAQPILLANYGPRVTLPVQNASLSIERAETPPWATGPVIGTYAAAVRLGDVFIGAMPGEPFPQLHYALRDCGTLPQGIEPGTDCGGIRGTRANFMLGAANDFLGYMLYTPEQYQQSFREGAFYLGGCPEEQLQGGLGQEFDGACPDHWALMVSPTIGRHLVCTLQDAAADLGFTVGAQNDECPLLTAFDGFVPPAEYPAVSPVPMSPAEFINSPASGLVAECRTRGGPAQLCDGLLAVSDAIGAAVGAATGSNLRPPATVSRAGVASRDASWHLGASAGQFADSGVGIARDAGFDPYGHSTRKVGSDILGTRIVTRALVVEDGAGARVAVVANDLYLPNDLLHRRVAQKLREHDALVRAGRKAGTVTGISGANLATTVSHSHTSPFYSTPGWGTWIFQDVFDLRFYEYMATQMADAVIEAAATLKPARMGGAVVPFNAIQAHTYGPKGPGDVLDGTPGGQPYDYTTQQVSVVRFDEIDGGGNFVRPLANWVIFGVHPEWVWGEEIVNGDVTHATMRMLDRETGALTVMSQSETGASGPHKDERVHRGAERREFQESALAGADRAGRLLADAVKGALAKIAAGDASGTLQFAPLASRFRVAHDSLRVAPPLTRPYPGVSNCNTDRTFEGDVGIPILGFPDCFYDHTEFTDVVTEPFLAALPYSPTQLRDQLLGLGVPVPTSYSATTLTAVEETAAVHLQVFKLGDIVATMSPTEQFTSGALNLVGRLDKVPGNHWHGYDWVCQLPPTHPARAGESMDVAAFCARQQARFPESKGMRGSVDNLAAIARIRAQIHNDAAGWELDPVYAFGNLLDDRTVQTDGITGLGGESESADPAQIKGNFTREEFTDHGYGMVVPVGMVNDYWGYMPEYREYRSHDHYRKALNGLGPHGADFVNTRLARMAARLNGARVTLPFNPLDTVYQAEAARAESLAQTLGELARVYTGVYEAQLPADGGVAGITQQPGTVVGGAARAQVPRFSAAVLKFIGGSNYTDMPEVRVERLVSGDPATGTWETFGTQMGEVQLQLAFLPSLSALPCLPTQIPEAGGTCAGVPDPAALLMWRAGLFQWEWTASFEAFVSELPNLGDRPGVTPLGTYRFVVNGRKRGASGTSTYAFTSNPFDVVPWGGITVDDIRLEADRRVSFAVGPRNEFRNFKSGAGNGDITIPGSQPPYVVEAVDYPDSYTGGLSWIRNERQLFQYNPGRDDDQQYCSRCTFRPWAERADVASAAVTVTRLDGSRYTLAAQRQGGRWVTSAALGIGETARVRAGGIVDQYGEINGRDSAVVGP